MIRIVRDADILLEIDKGCVWISSELLSSGFDMNKLLEKLIEISSISQKND